MRSTEPFALIITGLIIIATVGMAADERRQFVAGPAAHR